MFRNYLTIALRNLVRHKLYSFINIAGLAVGLACVIFIILFVRDELSYDKWVPDQRQSLPGRTDHLWARPTATGHGRRSHFPCRPRCAMRFPK